jgi:hypothetical protein
MLNLKIFETVDQSAGSNGNSEEQKSSTNSSIVNSEGSNTVKLDHKFSINYPLKIESLRGKPLTYNI